MKKMDEIMKGLKDTVKSSFSNSDIERINWLLSSLDNNTLVTGVGGSSVVADYVSKILNTKNRIIANNVQPRDLLYMNLDSYQNVVACSYSGNNYGVDMSFSNDLDHYLLTGCDACSDDVAIIKYCMDKEKSFISLGATLVPCSIILNYYLNDIDMILDSIKSVDYSLINESQVYEIFSGFDTSVLSTYLESTMVEAGIGVPVVHDKYNYCHGRSTLCTKTDSSAIYFNKNTEFDKLMIDELSKYYKDVITIDVQDGLFGEYKALIDVMFLTKYLADNKDVDLSKIDYNPIVKKLYKYNGSI